MNSEMPQMPTPPNPGNESPWWAEVELCPQCEGRQSVEVQGVWVVCGICKGSGRVNSLMRMTYRPAVKDEARRAG